MITIGTISSSDKSVPNAPTIGTATNVGSGRAFNNGRSDVTFTAPAYTGRLPITSYTVTSSPGAFTGTGAASPISVTGLQSNTAYTFTVTGTNSVGTSAASAASNSITASTVPQAPTIGTATASGTSASVTFTAGSTGGSAITGYTATSSPGGFTGTGASSPITVSGLTPGTSYTFTVTATNANGTSAASAASNSITSAYTTLMATLTDTFGVLTQNVSTDVDGNIYSVTRPDFIRITGAGTIGLQRGLIGNTGYNQNCFINSGKTGIYLGGYATNNSGDPYVAKYDYSGNLQWQRKYSQGAGNFRLFNFTVDSSENSIGVWGSGHVPGNSVIAKWNSSGTLQWQKQFNTTTSATWYQSVSTDSSGNIYAGGQEGSGAGIVKYNSSGTIQWAKTVTDPFPYGFDMSSSAVDSSGNVYAYATTRNASINWGYLIKFDSSGNITWQRKISGWQSNTPSPAKVILDNTGSNAYVVFRGRLNLSGNNRDTIIALKYNSSGTIQWQRYFSNNSYNNWAVDAACAFDTASGLLVVSGSTYTTAYTGFIARVPVDGSKTGTYTVGGQTIVYAASSLTDAAGDLSNANTTYTQPSITVGDVAASLSSTTTTATMSLIGI